MCTLRYPNMLVTLLLAAACPHCLAETPGTRGLLTHLEISKGICAVPNCGMGDLAIEIAKQSGFLVHGFDSDQTKIDQAVQRAERAKMLGDRVVFERLQSTPLPYADNMVDCLVVEPTGGVTAAEVERVVRPRGYALVRSSRELADVLQASGFEVETIDGQWQLARKPSAAGTDDWSHWSHGPDNNPVSSDVVVEAPYSTQWLAKPYYHAMPVVTTASAGRVFIASGHIAHHDREIPTLNTLVARNGYNGRILWQRDLPEGYLVHRSAFVATETTFYMMHDDHVLQLDPETGTELGRIRVPGVEGSLKWTAKLGDVLYVLAGPKEPPAEVMKVHANWRGWGWSNVDQNYSPRGKHQIRWGFGETIAAYDLAKNELLWKHDDTLIDSRGMGMIDNKLFYYVPAQKLVCLDRLSGNDIWANEDHDRLALIEGEALGLAGTPGFRTTAMLLATPVGVFIQGQKRANVLGFSIDDGRFLWSRKKYHNNPNMLYVDDRLFISGIEQDGAVQVIEPETGDTLENLNFWKGSCTRLTGSPEALYCRGEGLGRYDLKEKFYAAERTARPGCNDGAIAANGLLYVGPWLCDCNLSILGQMVLAPARGFEAQTRKLSDAHLDRANDSAIRDPIAVNEHDWPVYRANTQRTASSTATVPSNARVLWQFQAGTRDTFRTQAVTAGGRVFVAGEDGFVRCLEADEGTELWSHATGGPILAAPTFWKGRVFAGSGDGYIYCLEAMNGRFLWRFRVAPIERRIMVYGHLVSAWPVNSGVLIHNGTAYATGGIIFRDGTHVVALDARSGRLRWHNGTVGKPINDRFELQAASAMGTMAIGKNRLWLASGNVLAPVSFDLETGEASLVPGQRTPEWNTVMAQKPEPAGRDIMVFGDRFMLHGGRLLYSGAGHVVSSAQVNFRALDDKGNFIAPAFTPVRHCAIPPAWNNETFVMPTSMYGDVVTWTTTDVEKHLLGAVSEMVKLDEKVPGDNPQKWGQYNLIGKIFSAVERDLRASSRGPVIRDKIYGLAVTQNAVVTTGCSGDSASNTDFVAAYATADHTVLWKVDLPSEPSLAGLSVDRHGSTLITLANGTIVCVGH